MSSLTKTRQKLDLLELSEYVCYPGNLKLVKSLNPDLVRTTFKKTLS